MEMHPVSSSNVQSIGYDEDSETLQVQFNNGAMYQYFDVPQAIFEGLLQTDTVGGYMHEHVKGTYRYSKV